MKYVQQTMAPDEVIIAVAHFPAVYDLISLFWLLSIIGIPVFLERVIRKSTTELAVTSKRFVFKRGFISRVTDEFTTNRIQHVKVKQSFWGRLFNYGRVQIKGADFGELNLPLIANPTRFRRALILSADNGAPELGVKFAPN